MSAKNSSVLSSEEVDFEKIEWYAKRAKLAYSSAASIRQTFSGTKHVGLLDSIDVQYFLEITSANTQLVSVRGTANLTNAKEDAEFVKAKDKQLDIYVHKGFEQDAMAIYNDLLPLLDKTLPIQLTGHSLGAAISTLLMMYLHDAGFSVKESINFGQPKVTNKEGVEKYDFLPLIRVVDKDDIVPLVPPKNLLDLLRGSYEHLGQELILLRDQYYVLLSEARSEAISVNDFWQNIGHENITDHYMDHYLENIQSKLAGAESVSYSQRHSYE